MNCQNCGQNYSSSVPNCPYCGTENPKGEAWLLRIGAARAEYENTLEKHGTSVDLLVFDRVIGRILLGIISLFICLFIGFFAYFAISSKVKDISSDINRDKTLAKLEQLYIDGRFVEMKDFISRNDRYGSDYPEYFHMAHLYGYYLDFSEYRLQFFETRDTVMSDNDAYFLVSSMHNVLSPPYSLDLDITERNRENLEAYQTEVRDFAINMLGFSEKELTLLSGEKLEESDQDALEALIIKGGHAK